MYKSKNRNIKITQITDVEQEVDGKEYLIHGLLLVVPNKSINSVMKWLTININDPACAHLKRVKHMSLSVDNTELEPLQRQVSCEIITKTSELKQLLSGFVWDDDFVLSNQTELDRQLSLVKESQVIDTNDCSGSPQPKRQRSQDTSEEAFDKNVILQPPVSGDAIIKDSVEVELVEKSNKKQKKQKQKQDSTPPLPVKINKHNVLDFESLSNNVSFVLVGTRSYLQSLPSALSFEFLHLFPFPVIEAYIPGRIPCSTLEFQFQTNYWPFSAKPLIFEPTTFLPAEIDGIHKYIDILQNASKLALKYNNPRKHDNISNNTHTHSEHNSFGAALVVDPRFPCVEMTLKDRNKLIGTRDVLLGVACDERRGRRDKGTDSMNIDVNLQNNGSRSGLWENTVYEERFQVKYDYNTDTNRENHNSNNSSNISSSVIHSGPITPTPRQHRHPTMMVIDQVSMIHRTLIPLFSEEIDKQLGLENTVNLLKNYYGNELNQLDQLNKKIYEDTDNNTDTQIEFKKKKLDDRLDLNTVEPELSETIECDVQKSMQLLIAAKNIDLPYLCTGYDLYLMHEPCTMCAMAALHARFRRVFFVHSSKTHGALGSMRSLHLNQQVNHRYEVFHIMIQE